ncbi:MAG: response regulator transcription factor [Bdellovibrionales bacterium]|nr:response regulator transcription factor [Bdellovibrionales bacterium]
MTPKDLILVIDDEPQIQRLLTASLEPLGFRTLCTGTASEGLRAATQQPPAVVLLDIGLPDSSGFEVLKQLREWSDVPVIILSAQSDESDKVRGLELGADDYLTKPFGISELVARIRAVTRRRNKTTDPVLSCGDLSLDIEKHVAQLRGQALHLTQTEYSLLALLMRNAGKIITHQVILREVWGPNQTEQVHYVRIYMKALRQKVEDNPSVPRRIITEPGIGYRLVE